MDLFIRRDLIEHILNHFANKYIKEHVTLHAKAEQSIKCFASFFLLPHFFMRTFHDQAVVLISLNTPSFEFWLLLAQSTVLSQTD